MKTSNLRALPLPTSLNQHVWHPTYLHLDGLPDGEGEDGDADGGQERDTHPKAARFHFGQSKRYCTVHKPRPKTKC